MCKTSCWKRLMLVALLTTVISLLANDRVLADDYPCTGMLGAITVDNLRVPPDALCNLNGTRVEGNIFVERSATLLADGVHVEGNIQAKYAARVNVYPGSWVGGNIQIIKSGAVDIQGVQIHSDMQLWKNHAFLNIARNTIAGNLQATRNTGELSIIGNTIGGNLQCKGNRPPPTGGGNEVQGNMECQCENFGGNPLPVPPPVPPFPVPREDLPLKTYLPMLVAG